MSRAQNALVKARPPNGALSVKLYVTALYVSALTFALSVSSLCVGSLTTLRPLYAQPNALQPLASKASLSVHVIEVLSDAGSISPSLTHLQDRLRQTFPKSGFRALSASKLTLSTQPSLVLIAEELQVSFELERVAQDYLTFTLSIPQKKARLKVNARRGELFFQAMSWRSKRYLLALVASP